MTNPLIKEDIAPENKCTCKWNACYLGIGPDMGCAVHGDTYIPPEKEDVQMVVKNG